MSYIDEIFERTDIQHIREFLLHGVECNEVDPKTYKQRIDEPQKELIAIVQAKFPEMDKKEAITTHIYKYASAIEDVYMEIGMQCGAVLLSQLLENGKNKKHPQM